MIILYLEVLIGICLVVVEMIMLRRMKARNEAWWRTYWAKEKMMLDKLLETERKIDEMWRDM